MGIALHALLVPAVLRVVAGVGLLWVLRKMHVTRIVVRWLRG